MNYSVKHFVTCVVVGVFSLSLSHTACSREKITLKAAVFDDGRQNYYHELLREALQQIGYELELEEIPNVPQKRIEVMLDQEDSMLFYWFLQTKDRDERWTSIELGLTNGLIGHRILFIPKGRQSVYDHVNTLDDFKSLNFVGAFGETWYDAKVWEYNDLHYHGMKGDWQRIYNMLALGNRGIDYFSRGFNEILGEAPLHPDLDIEQRLMLIYDRDFHFYMSKAAGEAYKEIIENALLQAKETGLMDTLMRKHWAENFERLNFDGRVKIKLETPPQ